MTKAVKVQGTKGLAKPDTSNLIKIAQADNYVEAIAQQMGRLGVSSINSFDLQQFRTPSGKTTLWENGMPDIEGIILQIENRRTYWADPDPSGKQPDCVSADLIRGVGTPGGECIKCPFAQFGSASKGTGQACKEWRVVYILNPIAWLPGILYIPPSSIKTFQQYMIREMLTAGLQPEHNISRFRLEATRNKQDVEYPMIRPGIVRALETREIEAVTYFQTNVMPDILRNTRQLLDNLEGANRQADPEAVDLSKG